MGLLEPTLLVCPGTTEDLHFKLRAQRSWGVGVDPSEPGALSPRLVWRPLFHTRLARQHRAPLRARAADPGASSLKWMKRVSRRGSDDGGLQAGLR